MKYKILIADDNPEFVDALKFRIHAFLGDKIEYLDVAFNGKEVLEKYKMKIYNYIFMDINMPLLDGIEATRIIRESNPLVKIIGMSFNSEIDTVNHIIESGANWFIRKENIELNILKKIFEILIVR